MEDHAVAQPGDGTAEAAKCMSSTVETEAPLQPTSIQQDEPTTSTENVVAPDNEDTSREPVCSISSGTSLPQGTTVPETISSTSPTGPSSCSSQSPQSLVSRQSPSRAESIPNASSLSTEEKVQKEVPENADKQQYEARESGGGLFGGWGGWGAANQTNKEARKQDVEEESSGGWGGWFKSTVSQAYNASSQVVADLLEGESSVDDGEMVRREEAREAGAEGEKEKKRRMDAANALREISQRKDKGEETGVENRSQENPEQLHQEVDEVPQWLSNSYNTVNNALVTAWQKVETADYDAVKKRIEENLTKAKETAETVVSVVMGEEEGDSRTQSMEELPESVAKQMGSAFDESADPSISPQALKGFALYFDDALGVVRLQAMELLSTEVAGQIAEKRQSWGDRMARMDAALNALRDILEEDGENSMDEDENDGAALQIGGRAAAPHAAMIKEGEASSIAMTELIEEFKGKVQACEHKGAQMDLLEEYLTKLHNTALKYLANYSSCGVEVLMRTAEAWLIAARSTGDEDAEDLQRDRTTSGSENKKAEECVNTVKRLTLRMSHALSEISHAFAQATQETMGVDSLPESAMEHMNEIYMDAGDAISKVRDAKTLTLPLIQWVYITDDAKITE